MVQCEFGSGDHYRPSWYAQNSFNPKSNTLRLLSPGVKLPCVLFG